MSSNLYAIEVLRGGKSLGFIDTDRAISKDFVAALPLAAARKAVEICTPLGQQAGATFRIRRIPKNVLSGAAS